MGFDKSQPKQIEPPKKKQFGEGLSFSFRVRQTWGPLSYATSGYRSVALSHGGGRDSHFHMKISRISLWPQLRFTWETWWVWRMQAPRFQSHNTEKSGLSLSPPCLTGDFGAQHCEECCPGRQWHAYHMQSTMHRWRECFHSILTWPP